MDSIAAPVTHANRECRSHDASHNGGAHALAGNRLSISPANPIGPAHVPAGAQTRKSRAKSNGRAHIAADSQLFKSPSNSNVGAPVLAGTHFQRSPDIAQIIQLWRRPVDWMRAAQRIELQAQAICRRSVAGDKIKARALWKKAQKTGTNSVLDLVLGQLIAALECLRGGEAAALEKTLSRLAKQTPYWATVKQIRGFGAMNLAGLIGAAGDLASYRNPSCLWKRMGLAVIDGERQRKCLNKDKAELHGYCPERRAQMYVLGECLIKAKSQYKSVYDERKAAKIAAGWTQIHAHKDAMRFMVKRVLRDLWIATQPHAPPLTVAAKSTC